MMYKLFCGLLKTADVKQTDAVLKAATMRRQELFPEWDIVYIALPKKDPKRRAEMLQEMVNLEKNNQ